MWVVWVVAGGSGGGGEGCLRGGHVDVLAHAGPEGLGLRLLFGSALSGRGLSSLLLLLLHVLLSLRCNLMRMHRENNSMTAVLLQTKYIPTNVHTQPIHSIIPLQVQWFDITGLHLIYLSD